MPVDVPLERDGNAQVQVPDRSERVMGCILGGAVGDAFGYAVEFMRLAAIRLAYGESGLVEPVLERGRLVVSDDTQMTLFTLVGITDALERGERSAAGLAATVRIAYLDWHATQGSHSRADDSVSRSWLAAEPAMQVQRAPGNTCSSALRQGGLGTPERRINDSKGCGGVMRSAPAGFLGAFAWTRQQAFDLGARTGAITHGHPTGFIASGTMAALIHEIFAGAHLRTAAGIVLDDLQSVPEAAETVTSLAAAIRLAEDADTSPLPAVQRLGEGWIAEEALAIGVYASLVGGSFADAIRIAANHDGDSDSTASIAGQLWGAQAGIAAVPGDWAERLDVGDAALRACSEFLVLGGVQG